MQDLQTDYTIACVFDCSAVMALIQAEPGASLLEHLASGAMLSTVNLAEAHTKLVAKGVPEGI